MAEKAGTQRYRARLRAARTALEARLLAAWQQRQAAERQRLESQRATAAADERAAQARLPRSTSKEFSCELATAEHCDI